jgi:hypothetical protein
MVRPSGDAADDNGFLGGAMRTLGVFPCVPPSIVIQPGRFLIGFYCERGRTQEQLLAVIEEIIADHPHIEEIDITVFNQENHPGFRWIDSVDIEARVEIRGIESQFN